MNAMSSRKYLPFLALGWFGTEDRRQARGVGARTVRILSRGTGDGSVISWKGTEQTELPQ